MTAKHKRKWTRLRGRAFFPISQRLFLVWCSPRLLTVESCAYPWLQNRVHERLLIGVRSRS
jgi:hypothetical protein